MPVEDHVRWASAAVLVGWAAGVVGAGCSSGSGNSASDASTDSSVAPVDASEDGSTPFPDVDAGPPVVRPKVYVVNASPDAPALRFCLGVGAPADSGAVIVSGGFVATPDTPNAGFGFPGVFPGYGAPLADHGLDLDALTLSVFGVDATQSTVASNTVDGGLEGGLEAPCEALIGSDGLGTGSNAGGVLKPGRDFWWLGSVPAGTLGHGSTWLAVVTGCLPAEADAATLCPAGYDPNRGNMSLQLLRVDAAETIPPGSIGAQFAQASSEWDNLARRNGAVTSAGFLVRGDGGTPDAGALDAEPDALLDANVDAPVDAGVEASADATDEEGSTESGADGSIDAGAEASADAAPAPPWAGFSEVVVAANASFSTLQPAAMASVPGVALDGGSGFFAQMNDVAGMPVPSTLVGAPLPFIQALSWPGAVSDGGAIRTGAGFVFVLVGNPASTAVYVNPIDGGPSSLDAGGVYNGHAPHFLAFPVETH